jgi:hypothetical protein
MSERKLTILQLNDLHGYLEPHPEVYRAPMLGVQGVPKKYGSNRQKTEFDAIEALQGHGTAAANTPMAGSCHGPIRRLLARVLFSRTSVFLSRCGAQSSH